MTRAHRAQFEIVCLLTTWPNGALASGIAANVNGDSRPDIVTNGHNARAVSVYVNGSSGGFTEQ